MTPTVCYIKTSCSSLDRVRYGTSCLRIHLATSQILRILNLKINNFISPLLASQTKYKIKWL